MFYAVINEWENLWHRDCCILFAFPNRYRRDKFTRTHKFAYKLKPFELVRIYGENYEKYICNEPDQWPVVIRPAFRNRVVL